MLFRSDESIALYQEIERLRRAGERVVVELPGQHQSAQEMGCDRKLVQQEGRWTVATL